MNHSSYSMMRNLLMKYVPPETGLVYDIGSYDVNGTLKPLVRNGYVGVDIRPGPNVDVVVSEDGEWNLKVGDAAISANTVEHVRNHRHPVDCWRILPDGMEELFQWARLEVREVGIQHRFTYGAATVPT
jgi:hypothetical protein